jgi:hypothetical protein
MKLESPEAELVRNLVQALSLTYDQVILHLAIATRADLYNVIFATYRCGPKCLA